MLCFRLMREGDRFVMREGFSLLQLMGLNEILICFQEHFILRRRKLRITSHQRITSCQELGILMIKNGLSVLLLKPQKGLLVPSLVERLVVVSDHVGGFSSSSAAMAMAMAMAMGSRRFFNAGGITTSSSSSSSSSLMKRDMFQASDIPNLFRGRQTGGCVGSFIPRQCNKSHMLPYFARALASSSASQSSGQTPRQELEKKKKKKECQIKTSSELQREKCDEISSTEVSLNQFPGLMVHGNVEDSKTRRLLRLNPDTGYFEEEEEQDVSAAAAASNNHHGHYDLQVPNGHVCRGSAYGWLFVTDDNLDMKLLNPFSGAEIQLPPVKTLPLSEHEEHHMSKWSVYKAVFSANPSIEPRPVVLVIYGLNIPKLAFCKPGDKGWTPLEFPPSIHLDAIYHKGQFYVLGYPGSVVAFDIGRCIDDDDHSVKTVIVATDSGKRICRDWYFVVLDGEFVRFEFKQTCFRDCCIDWNMRVLEFERNRDGDTSDENYYEWKMDGDTTYEEDYIDEENDDDDDGIKDRNDERRNGKFPCIDLHLPRLTYSIKIRRFDVSENQWVKVESLGGKAVFLGYNTSFALSASDYPAGVCIPDSVYFSFGCGGGGDFTEMRGYDVGIYNVKNQSFKRLFPPIDDVVDEASQFIRPAPIWIVNPVSIC